MASEKTKGYLYGIIAAASYGMNPVFALPLMSDGMDAVSVLFFRYMLAIPAVWIMMVLRGRNARIGRRRILPCIILGLCMVLSSISLFRSYLFMDIGIASTLLFVYPLLVALIMAALYGETLTRQAVIGLSGTFAGVWLLCDTGTDVNISAPGIILVLVSSLTYAIYIVGINRPPVKSVATLSLTVWILVAGAAVLGVIVLTRGYVVLPRMPWLWINVLLLALVPTVISFLCTNIAIEKIGSTPAAALGAFEPVTALIFGVMLFGEHLSLRSIAGFILIILCVTLVITGEGMTRRVLSVRKLFPKVHRSHRSGRQ
ncbi:MAG: DMT family transporter [Muribaculaceae bacterium]|nr:DMT family transporter [Muribaculaceae bacterium]